MAVLGGHAPGPGMRLDEGLLVGLTAAPKAYLDQERGGDNMKPLQAPLVHFERSPP